ncbi:hypothetical protein [Leucobacter massiliensis]|uniref:Uncharacterized protein n=1 Tax=Leucobacter massiliensis TaxID=1686285 RepID=A0A2S9QK91_9MICO|nr:hypothetical protein [Leucobacter massiliensis]PRI10010.1 hypothetical protein B4915_13885 [Leucobacter massiliensis]
MQHDGEHPAPEMGARPDPTKVTNQAALQRSSGTVWIVMGGLFLLAALVPLGAFAFAGSGRSAGLAIPVGVVLIVLYLALLLARLTIAQRRARLRVMAASMLTMAVVALIGVASCAWIEAAAGAAAG